MKRQTFEGIHKYLSFLIRRPSSAFNLKPRRFMWTYSNAASLFSGKRTMFRPGRDARLNMFGWKPEEEERSKNPIITPRETTENNFSWMILKPILKVINNQGERMLKIIVIIFVGDLVICLLFAVVFLLLLFLLKTQEQQQKTIINHFIYFATYAHEKSVRHSSELVTGAF